MGVSFEKALDNVEAAAEELFDADPRVRSVGIARHATAYGFRAVRNSAVPVPLSAGVPAIKRFNDIPVVQVQRLSEPMGKLWEYSTPAMASKHMPALLMRCCEI